jgi:hypothetical protein
VATAQDVRRLALALPRAYEALVRDHVKFRVGRIVFLSISPDEELLGFGFPKEERAALVASEPDKFLMPLRSDERYNWVRARLAKLDEPELAELVVDARPTSAAIRPSPAGRRRGRAGTGPQQPRRQPEHPAARQGGGTADRGQPGQARRVRYRIPPYEAGRLICFP